MNAHTRHRGWIARHARALALGSSLIAAACSSGGQTGQAPVVTLQSIAITPPLPSVAPGFTIDLVATGTYSNATTADLTDSLQWTSADTDKATVVSTGTDRGRVTGIASGTVQISALDPATGLNATVSLIVNNAALASIAITPSASSSPLGLSRQFTATGTFTDSSTADITSTVTWRSSATDVLVISDTAGTRGLAVCVGTGSATITAEHPATAITGTTSFTVTSATLQSITVTPGGTAIALGYDRQFTATGNYSDGTTQDLTTAVVWSSSQAGIATISNAGGTEGLASTVGVGTTEITATHDATSIAGSTTLQVTPAELVSITVTPTGQSVVAGYTEQFTATGTFSDATTEDLTTTVTWSSGSPLVASISNASGSEGLATGLAAGTATIVATDPGTSIAGSTTLDVSAAVLESIMVIPNNPSRALGYSQQFTALGVFSDNTMQDMTSVVTWASSDTATATISNASGSKGLATTVDVGTTTITATHAGSGFSDDTTFTVTAVALASIAITPSAPSTALGYSQQFTATGTFSDSSTQDITATVTWSSSNEAVALVSNASGTQGLGMPVSTGVATISAIDPATGITASTTFTITPAVLVSITITPSNPTAAAGGSQQFTATGNYSDNTTADITTGVVWSSSHTNVATISNTEGTQGLASLVGAGTAMITATHASTSIAASTTLTVTSSD